MSRPSDTLSTFVTVMLGALTLAGADPAPALADMDVPIARSDVEELERSVDPLDHPSLDPEPQRPLGMSILGTGAGLVLSGFFTLIATIAPACDAPTGTCNGNIAGTSIGLGLSPLFTSVGAHLGQRSQGGRARFGHSLLGAFVGGAIGVGVLAMGIRFDSLATIVAGSVLLPVLEGVGAVLGSHLSRRRPQEDSTSVPTLSLSPRGAVLGVGGIFLRVGLGAVRPSQVQRLRAGAFLSSAGPRRSACTPPTRPGCRQRRARECAA